MKKKPLKPVSLLKLLYLILKSILLNLLLSLRIKEKNLNEELKMNQKNKSEKPTKEQLKKVKKSPGLEKKPPFPFPPEEEVSLKESSLPGSEEEETSGLELEEICGNLWIVLYQLGGILKKGFEPLTDDVRNLLAPPSARIAKKIHIENYLSDEVLILGVLGIDVSKRLMVKKKDDKNDNRKTGKGKDDTQSQPDIN